VTPARRPSPGRSGNKSPPPAPLREPPFRVIPRTEQLAAARALDRVGAAGHKAWLEFQARYPDQVSGTRRKASPGPAERRR
jgi:hypothetical protein